MKSINGALYETHGLLELSNGIGFDFCYTNLPVVLD